MSDLPQITAVLQAIERAKRNFQLDGSGWTAGLAMPSGKVVLHFTVSSIQEAHSLEQALGELGYHMTILNDKVDFIYSPRVQGETQGDSLIG